MNMTNKRDCFHSILVILCLLSTYASSVKVAAAEKKFMESSSGMDNTRQLASSSVWTNFLSKFDVLSRIYSKKKKEESKEYNLTFLPSFRFASLSTSSSSLPS